MALTYRAQLAPTAAIDAAGNAKPNTTFEVRARGGSAVPVYAVATGGSALTADQITTDSLGNLGGFYVDTPGTYDMVFPGGASVPTIAVRDDRDIPDAATPPTYAYDGFTGGWSVTPGQNPGSALFQSGGMYSTDTPPTTGGNGMYASQVPLEANVANPDVATLSEDGMSWRFAAPGLYLVRASISLFAVGSPDLTDPEEYLQVDLALATQQWWNVPTWVMNTYGVVNASISATLLAMDTQPFDGHIDLRSKTHVWQGHADAVTIVRLD